MDGCADARPNLSTGHVSTLKFPGRMAQAVDSEPLTFRARSPELGLLKPTPEPKRGNLFQVLGPNVMFFYLRFRAPKL